MHSIGKIMVATVTALTLAACGPASGVSPESTPPVAPAPGDPAAPDASTSLTYRNDDYGFVVTLPADWDGYQIVEDTWSGNYVQNDQQQITGPLILVRSPRWRQENPTQDLPVMVIPLDVWEGVMAENVAVSAAPIPPTEFARGDTYVFALPARYDFANLPGADEVRAIVDGGAVTALD